ncbi:MAG: hypothetical protein DRP74_02740 [Candidatus Omnitrophota bacterium]|nr:MAG: hypothetical protein DRP74_02740 [Candidatus Omnitrophota bacterium]
MQLIKRLWKELLRLLFNDSGLPEGEEENSEGDEGNKEEEDQEDEGNEEDAGEEEGGDADDDSGKSVGKERSKFIPRERFDKVNTKAQKLEKLIELGVLTEDASGEIRVNSELLKNATKQEGSKELDTSELRFTKDEADERSWPLLEKINKAYDHYDKLASRMSYMIKVLQSENAVLRDYPEFISKDSPIRKKALEIIRNDPEFRRTYRGNPEAGYWAVKRAAEFLAGKTASKPKKKKGSFIVGKGDAGAGGKKKIDFTKLSSAELDKLEREEHNRLFAGNKK